MNLAAEPRQGASPEFAARAYPAWLRAQPRLRVGVLTAILYGAAMLISILIAEGELKISTIWIASGVGLIAVLIWGYWLLPVLAGVHLAVDTVMGGAALAVGTSLVATTEIGAAAWLLARGARSTQGGALSFDLSGTARFVVVCLLLVPIGGGLAAASWLWLIGEVPGEAFLLTARNWWLSVMLGFMCITPLVDSWLVHGVPHLYGRAREALVVLVALIVLSSMILTYQVLQQSPVEAVFYASLPILLWASVFLRETGAATALTLATALAIGVSHLNPEQAMPIWNLGAHIVAFGVMSMMVASAQTNLAQMLIERTRQAQLTHLAYHDSLTGLANRPMYYRNLAAALASVDNRGRRVAVLFIDLDGFKWINDTLGHAAGDELIRRVADRFVRLVDPGNLVARLGGDEFGVLIEDLADVDAARQLAQRVLHGCSTQPIWIDGNPIYVEASIGMAVHPDHASQPEELLRLADLAMYQAKKFTGPSVVVFSAELEREAHTRHELQQDLRHAAAQGQFWLAYQPVVNLHTQEVTCVEALLRWQHPTRGLIPPDEFIPLMEQSGVITSVGRWVLGQACMQAAQWRRKHPDLRVAVNVSAAQFQTDDVLEAVKEALAAAELAPEALMIEMTESVFADQVPRASQGLRNLADHGVCLAMDDFGTGYSALASLQHLPLDVIKIDRSFVADMLTDPTGHALIRTILDLAQTLGLESVAEGVEHEAQAQQLREIGCPLAQGHLFSLPEPAERMSDWLERRSPPRTVSCPAAHERPHAVQKAANISSKATPS